MANLKLRRPIVVGHRGAPRIAPENTLASFEAAIRLGVDGVELDARLSKDEVPVVLHDRSLIRTTMKRGMVDELSAAELAGTAIRDTGDVAHTDAQLPTLRTAIDKLQNRTHLYVELKVDSGSTAKTIGRVTAAEFSRVNNGQPQKVMSFSPAAIDSYSSHGPANTVLLLPNTDTTSTRVREQALAEARACGASTVGLLDASVTPSFVAYAHRWDIAVLTWPNADLTMARHSLMARVDILVTDDPGSVVSRLAPLAAPTESNRPSPL
jgi:glycerophosphoryl diester phosphodiesterase